MAMDPAVGFWNRFARRYARQPIKDQPTYQAKLELTRRYLDPTMRVLELGCGTGSTALLHAPHVAHYHAIDSSPRMIDIAREKLAQSGAANVTFDTAAFEEFEAPDGSFDAVLALNVLHLMADPEPAIRKAHRLLKPGGVFVTSTACLADTMAWFRFVAPVGRVLRLIPTVSVFSRRALQQSLERCGFEIVSEMDPSANATVYFGIAVRRAGP